MVLWLIPDLSQNAFTLENTAMLTFRHEGQGDIFYATRNSAGFDICANESVKILPGQRALVGTGLRIVESAGLETLKVGNFDVAVLPELQIRPRSGLAVKFGISVINSPSTIDADYRGEIKIALINHSAEEFEVHAGDRHWCGSDWRCRGDREQVHRRGRPRL